jgi:hypothetical protein
MGRKLTKSDSFPRELTIGPMTELLEELQELCESESWEDDFQEFFEANAIKFWGWDPTQEHRFEYAAGG